MAKKTTKKKTGDKGKTKKAKLLPQLKKDASVFLSSEEGKITKENVIKTAAALGIIGAALLKAAPAPAAHGNYLHNSGGAASHTSHGSHGSHGSHCRGGWCNPRC